MSQKILLFFIFIISFIILIYLYYNKNILKNHQALDEKTVIVVGAGISGLSSAKKLQDEGYEVIVLEAKDYVGGRIKTANIYGEKYELGASWIHGDENNPVSEILKQNGTKTFPTNWEKSIVYKNGKPIEFDEESIDTFFDFLESFKEESEKDIGLQDAWGKFSKEYKNDYSNEELKDFYHIISFYIENEVGTNMKDISTLEYGEEYGMEGGDKLVLDGYDSVINHLSENLNIKLNSIVTKIEDLGDSVVVYTKNGIKYKSSKIIVTVPLGVLQKKSIEFSPKIPEKKQKAIDNIKMGNLHKTFLLFENKFWDDVELISILNGDDTKWGDFINVSNAFNKNILLVLHAGDNSEILEKLNEETLGKLAFEKLKTIYPNATQPIQVVSSKWYADPFTLGSYSYVPVGAKISMYDDIAKPYGNIHFAGEHTNSKYPSTTHGAYISGIRAANEIINSLK